ncbi:MAG: FHA domain-containing protein [Actinomycetota bacterium]|nr:FHA domain-containing protein [Actinomycetota bacterium]
MFCTKCGHYNPESSIYCARCGAYLDKTSTEAGGTTVGLTAIESEGEEEIEVTPPLEPLEEGSALLVIKKGPDAGMRFTINRDVIGIGRHPESDIFLDDITVSRRHAEIRRSGNDYTLVDTGSLNGTYLNHDRIEDSILQSGDEIQIGKFKLLFFTG